MGNTFRYEWNRVFKNRTYVRKGEIRNIGKEKKPIIIETADIYLHFPYIIEEEADDLADFLEEEHIEYEGATDIFIDLQNQVKKQKEVVDKAIKYIKSYKTDYSPYELSDYNIRQILEILRGEDNE